MTTPSQPDAATPQHTPTLDLWRVGSSLTGGSPHIRTSVSDIATINRSTKLRFEASQTICDAHNATHAQLTADLAACRKALEDIVRRYVWFVQHPLAPIVGIASLDAAAEKATELLKMNPADFADDSARAVLATGKETKA